LKNLQRFAKLMSGAISMGIGDFMASKAGYLN
jgi:hypothetical protein